MPYKDPAKQREYYLKNRDKAIAYTYQYRRDHPEWWSGQRRNAQLKKLYGITLEEYNELMGRQKGLCSICRKEKPLQVDHDHKTGIVRGLLCEKCNKGLGMFEDDTEILMT